MPEPGGEPALPDEVTEDALLGGRVRLRQPRRGHRAGTDAVLLGHLPDPDRLDGATIVDAGAGTGAVGLIAAARAPSTRVILLERDAGLVGLARENIGLNGAGARARAVAVDLLEASPAALDLGAGADWVLTNPPFLEPGEGRPSPDPGRAAAHVLGPGGLAAWLRACAVLVRPGGRLGLVHRADRLAACLAGLGRGFGGTVLRTVHPRAEMEAHRILLTAVKGSRAPLSILPPLILHGPDGAFTPEAAALHGR